MSKLLSKIRHEVVVVGGIVTAVGASLAATLPSGAARTVVIAALPLLVGLVARTKTMSLASVNTLITAVKSATATKPVAVKAPAPPPAK